MSQMSKRNSWKRKGENPEKEKADPELLLWGPSKRKNFICLNKDTKKNKKNKHAWKIIIQYILKPIPKNSFTEMLLDDCLYVKINI